MSSNGANLKEALKSDFNLNAWMPQTISHNFLNFEKNKKIMIWNFHGLWLINYRHNYRKFCSNVQNMMRKARISLTLSFFSCILVAIPNVNSIIVSTYRLKVLLFSLISQNITLILSYNTSKLSHIWLKHLWFIRFTNYEF